MSPDKRSQSSFTLDHLNGGEIEIIGRMPYSSNGTFLTTVNLGASAIKAIYKPFRGERGLWDFPGGLFKREVAAFMLSDCLGWELVPETVLRLDAPLGEGSLQLFIEADFTQHYFSLFERLNLHEGFRKFALFDMIANNADRKSGHILLDHNDKLWGIDQGLCFHPEPKLRTVIWEFAGERIPQQLLDDVAKDIETCVKRLSTLLTSDEIEALAERASSVLKKKRFPRPDPDLRCYPWPLV